MRHQHRVFTEVTKENSMTTDATSTVVLDIEGMTCSSCVARVEKSLTELPGVTAAVNLATNTARVEFPRAVTTDALLAQVSKIGYSAHLPQLHTSDQPAESSAIRVRLYLAIALTAPLIAVAMVPAWQFMYWQWVSFALATPVVFYCGWPFHRATFINLRHGTLTMDTLITMGTLAAYTWSVYALVFGMAGMPGMRHGLELFAWQSDPTGNIYFEVAAGVTTFLLLGRFLEDRSKRTAGAALRALGQLKATEAVVLRGGVEQIIPAAQLRVGDEFIVRPGGIIATDGVVIAGRASVDESSLTGESMPVGVRLDAMVTGSTIVLDGQLTVRATQVGENTRMSQLARLVEDAQLHKAAVQRLADRISAIFVPIVIGLAALTFLGWFVAGQSVAAGFTAAVAVLVIACPCALGLATPVALMVGTGRAAQLGIIISGPDAIEASNKIDTVVLDKTGTVTSGAMSVTDVQLLSDADATDALRAIAAVESSSEHPLAQAIVRHVLTSSQDQLPAVTDFHSTAGFGVSGVVAQHTVFVGTERWLAQNHIELSVADLQIIAAQRASGASVILAGWDGKLHAAISIADTVRPDSREAVRQFTERGLNVVLLTGDHIDVARTVAAQVGITEVQGGITPEGKVAAVIELQRAGRRVAMIGDGVNDAAALAQADLGIAMGTGTDVAIAASDITLMRANLAAAVQAIQLSRHTLRTIHGNLFWAFAYNVAAIPLAALGFLNPMLAGAAMAFSSLFVVLNSLRLRRFAR
jgi:Cu+-exporting ATPase